MLEPTSARVRVDLGARSYDIVIEPGALARAGEAIAPLLARPRTVIVTDETVGPLYAAPLQRALARAGIASDVIEAPAGEGAKSFPQFERLIGRLLDLGVERADTVLALGGGVVGDLVGFACAVLRRGCDFVQIPTSLLAQVDSSVGGKTGINVAQGKNLVGAFHQPRAVLIDTDVLETLPQRHLRAGYAEIVKYGLLGDADFFAWLEANGASVLAGAPAARIDAIAHACRMKADVVAQDEREAGRRALLNLGHTFGHALEAATGYGEALLHGEAVAVGLRLAFAFSAHEGLCPPEDVRRVAAHLAAAGLPARLADIDALRADAGALLAFMRQDKKATDGRINLILARNIGAAFVAKDVKPERIEAFLAAELEV